MVEPKKSRKYSHFKFVFYDLVIPSIPSIWNLAISPKNHFSAAEECARFKSKCKLASFWSGARALGPDSVWAFSRSLQVSIWRYPFTGVDWCAPTNGMLNRRVEMRRQELRLRSTRVQRRRNEFGKHSSLWLIIVTRHCGSSLWLVIVARRIFEAELLQLFASKTDHSIRNDYLK